MKFKKITIIVAEDDKGKLSLLYRDGTISRFEKEEIAFDDTSLSEHLWKRWAMEIAGLDTPKALSGWEKKIVVWIEVVKLRSRYNKIKGPSQKRKEEAKNWKESIKRMADSHFGFVSRSKMDKWAVWCLTCSNNSDKRARSKGATIPKSRIRAEQFASAEPSARKTPSGSIDKPCKSALAQRREQTRARKEKSQRRLAKAIARRAELQVRLHWNQTDAGNSVA